MSEKKAFKKHSDKSGKMAYKKNSAKKIENNLSAKSLQICPSYGGFINSYGWSGGLLSKQIW